MESQPDPAAIDYYGTAAAKSSYANIVLTFMDVGIQLFMCIYGLSIFIETPREQRKGRIPFILISFAIWGFSSLPAALDSWTEFRKLFDAGPGGREYIIQWRKYGDNSLWYSIVGTTSLLIYIIIGDCLMLYRCFVLWRDQWWVIVPPVLAFITSLISGILTVYPVPLGVAQRLPTSLWTFMSVAMNIMVTVLIIIRLVRARWYFAKALPDRKSPSLYSSTIAIIIESAAPLAFFGLCFATTLLVTNKADTFKLYDLSIIYAFETTFALLYYSFCALAPQMIIFRVTTGRSWMGQYDNEKTTVAFSRPLEFASDDLEISRKRSASFSSGSNPLDTWISERDRA